MVFSRFVHRFERQGVTALYNSLRMLPVYMPTEEADELYWGFHPQAPIGGSRPPEPPTIKQLQNAKIMVPDPSYDQRILQTIRQTLKPPQIILAYFIVTENCNFNCSYCFVNREMPQGYKPLTMSRETAQAGIDTYARLSEGKGNRIVLFGGEPLLNFEVIRFIVLTVEEYKAQGRLAPDLSIDIVTNGALLSQEIAEFFHLHGVSVSVSIDGNDVTNANRKFRDGSPAYQAIRQGIAHAQKQDCDLSLSVAIQKDCMAHFDSTMHTLIDDIGAKNIGFNILMEDETDDLEYAEEAADFIIKAYQLFREKNIQEDRIMRKAAAFAKAELYPFDCAAAGANQIVIAPEGAIGVCHVQLGTRTDFTAHVQDPHFDPKKNPAFLEWNQRTPLNMEACQSCPALGICGGGCPFNARKKHGSLWSLDDRFCVHAKKTLEWLIWDLFEMIRKRGSGSLDSPTGFGVEPQSGVPGVKPPKKLKKL